MLYFDVPEYLGIWSGGPSFLYLQLNKLIKKENPFLIEEAPKEEKTDQRGLKNM